MIVGVVFQIPLQVFYGHIMFVPTTMNQVLGTTRKLDFFFLWNVMNLFCNCLNDVTAKSVAWWGAFH